jgi:hypothetical protein
MTQKGNVLVGKPEGNRSFVDYHLLGDDASPRR